VWISVIGIQEERTETVRALEHAMPFVRHELGSRLRLRRIPNLHVRLDETAEQGTRLLHLLDELEHGQTPEGEAPTGETLPTPVTPRSQAAEPDPSAVDAAAADLIVPAPPVNRAQRRSHARGSATDRSNYRAAGSSRRPAR